MFGRTFRSRAGVSIVSAVLAASATSGISVAIASTRDASPDRYYACVGTAGASLNKVKAATLRLNAPPVKCPATTDLVKSWNAQGIPGVPGVGSTNLALLKVTVDGAASRTSVVGEGLGCFSPQSDLPDSVVPSCGLVDVVGDRVALDIRSDKWLDVGGCTYDDASAACVVTLAPGDNNVIATAKPLGLESAATFSQESPGVFRFVVSIRNTADAPRQMRNAEFYTSSPNGEAWAPAVTGTSDTPIESTNRKIVFRNLTLVPGQTVTVTSRTNGDPCWGLQAGVEAQTRFFSGTSAGAMVPTPLSYPDGPC